MGKRDIDTQRFPFISHFVFVFFFFDSSNRQHSFKSCSTQSKRNKTRTDFEQRIEKPHGKRNRFEVASFVRSQRRGGETANEQMEEAVDGGKHIGRRRDGEKGKY